MADRSPEEIVAKYEKLKSERGTIEDHWQECADFALPRKDNITRTTTEGEKKGQRIYDSTAIQSNELLAGALHSMLTNPTTLWFDLTTGEESLDQDEEVKKWLEATARTMFTKMNSSNFQTEIHEDYLDLTTFGTGCLSIEEDNEFDIRFSSNNIADCCFDENNKGMIDEVYRSFCWSLKQIVQEFGLEVLPDELKKAYQEGKPDKYDIIHCVYPRDLEGYTEEQKKAPTGYPYGSQYILKKTKTKLKISGFREWPFAVPRWLKTSGEKHGRSPTMKALPDAKMLNAMKLTTIKGAQKTVDPPLQAPDDGFIGPIRTHPAGISYYRSGSQDRIEPVFNDARIDFGFQLINDVRTSIRQAYYIDQLQLQQGPQMTATEVNERIDQMLRFLGPVLGRLEFELLQPLITRVFGILLRKDKIPKPIPAKLSGRNLIVRYSSLVARAQKAGETTNIMRTLQAVAPFVQLNPEVMDNFDADVAVRYVAEINSLPQKLMKDKAEVDQMRKARNQAKQDALTASQQSQAAESISKVAPALAKAKEAGVV